MVFITHTLVDTYKQMNILQFTVDVELFQDYIIIIILQLHSWMNTFQWIQVIEPELQMNDIKYYRHNCVITGNW